MNRAERIFRFHSLLRLKKPVSVRALMDQTERSEATIKRDIEYMRNFMCAPINYDRANNRYYYDPQAPEFELPGLWFNASELYALLASEQLLETVQPGLLTPYIGPLRGRIRSLLTQSGHAADALTSRIRLLRAGHRLLNNELFGTVAAGVLQGRLLSISYHGREKNTESVRNVHPLQLLHHRNNWYVLAYCEIAQALRTFALDRMRTVTLLQDAVTPRDEQELDRYVNAAFGIFTGTANAWAVLRFREPAARWVADEQWHPEQLGVWEGDNFVLQVPYSDPRELLMDILKYSSDVEVTAPAELRNEVARRLQIAAAQYT